MSSNECKNLVHSKVINLASRKLHITKTNAAQMDKGMLCGALNTCTKKGYRFPMSKFVAEPVPEINGICFIQYGSPLTYKDYKVLASGNSKTKDVEKIAKKLGIENTNDANRGLILTMIKSDLKADGITLDPIIIRIPKSRGKTNKSFTFNENNKTFTFGENNNNNNKKTLTFGENNNNNNNNNNKKTFTFGENNNNNNNKKSNLKLTTSTNLTLSNKSVSNAPKLNAGAANLTLKSAEKNVKATGIRGLIGMKSKSSEDISLNKILSKDYGLMNTKSRIAFLQATANVNDDIRSINSLDNFNQAQIVKRIRFNGVRPKGNIASRLVNVGKGFINVSEMKNSDNTIRRNFTNIKKQRQLSSIKTALAKIMRDKLKKKQGKRQTIAKNGIDPNVLASFKTTLNNVTEKLG